jgi:ribonuclease R
MRERKQRRREKPDFEHEHIEDLPSRVAILEALESFDSPCGLGELAEHLGVSGKPALNALKRRLLAMARDGQLVRTRGARFGLASRMDLIAGRVMAHRDGFAFVRPERGGDDIFLAQREARRTLHGDKVLVRIAGLDHRGRPYGNLVEVLERANTTVVGRYFHDRGVGVVIADNRHINQDILIPEGAAGPARDGQIVVVAIEQQPDHRTQPIGRVVEVLGEHMAPGMEIEIAIRSHNLPAAWPPAVVAESAAVPARVTEADVAGRRDLRALPLVTIDGADARDFDDAVHARRTGRGFVLHVAIADVAHYVTPGSALDREALARGTSVYFPDRVIPMLPEKLSNGICSLNPDVDRLAMVCELHFDADGEVRRAQFYAAVIRSQARLVYEDVQRWVEGDRAAAPSGGEAVAESLACLYALYERLKARREARGALDIDTVEPRFIYDRNGKIARVEPAVRVDAHRVIEECMIAANVAAARFLLKRNEPALYRVHDRPDAEKVEALGQFLRELGLRFRLGEEPSPAAFAAVLAAARDRPDRRLIDTVVLRSLKLAVYSAGNAGHFGLALPAYTHFTSPIRRYPDLVVHRALKRVLAGATADETEPPDMAGIATQCSLCERRADEATRDAIAWLKCEFMLERVGERFSGIVAGVAEFGVFVELDDIFVEGLVHVTELPADYYHFDAVRHSLTGRSSGREFRIGQALDVIVARVDLDERKIDFTLADKAARPARRGRRRA